MRTDRWAVILASMLAVELGVADEVKPTVSSKSYSSLSLSVLDAYRVARSLTWWGMDAAMEAMGYDICPFAEDPVAAATQALRERVRAQPLAIESLLNALSSWQFSQRAGREEPLVLALTGSTGTGKTETAWVLAEGLLTKRCRISGGTRDIPRGLLVFNGGDYMMASKVEEYQKQIRRRLGERIEYCNGNVVVLFDELQKAAPGTLDALTEAMSEYPRVTYEDGTEIISADSSHVIFLLVSDVGAEGVNAAVLRYRNRSDVVAGTLQAAVKKALDEQWERLRFGKMVDKVIPYLPMDPPSNLLVVELKLQMLGKSLPGGLYTTSDLRWHLVQPRYIQYSTYHVKLALGGKEEVIRHDLAVYGARDVEKESMQRINGALRRHVLDPRQTCQADSENTIGAGDRERGLEVTERICWTEAFMIDVRYDTSLDQVSFYRCSPDYAEGLTEFEREHPNAVQGPKCELAWQGILHDHGAL